MARLLVLSSLVLLASCASDPASQKAAAARLQWCDPCVMPCQVGCGAVAAAPAPAPAPAPVVAPAPAPAPMPAAAAAFDPAPGEYAAAQSVKLSSPTANATIRYTTDGSAPTAASAVHAGPIAVTQDTTIRAVASAPGATDSAVVTGAYKITPPPPPAAPAKVTMTGKKLELMERVYFDTSKTTIKEVSFPLLDEVAQILAAHPEVKKVLVEGHTDDTGSAAFNTTLSQGRAEAVRDYLVKKGVAAERLGAKGFGPTQPIGDNKTAAGRDSNRRVEFTLE